ncbi:SSU ribosomal protein S20p [Pediococcus damnosus]|uniref:Small ribosomal subunit protein bS20 n=1 Tax=Pediococcus damnosus TaxID=51663 RepID=A0A143A7F2_9LACO|nr:30S ribosomal protein S20 [Pediococcus damnosus]AMV59802.1 SSU ribosomal protein S20p [Pediococcus damnosus]AMV61906.1 SSU ribosomal protein S20p [Pediococcus damnosus]AMV64048.1 SSU ribosomal protein S20p [Pediococcus damnosus]AMV66220.1 SSU ribosomal protein S20p [Pediococcus damnosus]AMV68499.1 SSU ribosomal protein S20p [Pediococcus damnosus]
MPVIKSAMKRVKTNEKAALRNQGQVSNLRSAVKKFEAAAVNGSDNKQDLYLSAISKIDQAKTKGLIKTNKAARTKSRLTKQLAK